MSSPITLKVKTLVRKNLLIGRTAHDISLHHVPRLKCSSRTIRYLASSNLLLSSRQMTMACHPYFCTGRPWHGMPTLHMSLSYDPKHLKALNYGWNHTIPVRSLVRSHLTVEVSWPGHKLGSAPMFFHTHSTAERLDLSHFLFFFAGQKAWGRSSYIFFNSVFLLTYRTIKSTNKPQHWG